MFSTLLLYHFTPRSLKLIFHVLVEPTETAPLTNGITDKDNVDPVMGKNDIQASPRLEEPPQDPSPPPARPKTSSNRPTTSKDRRQKQKSPDPSVNGLLSTQNSIEEPQVLGGCIRNFNLKS